MIIVLRPLVVYSYSKLVKSSHASSALRRCVMNIEQRIYLIKELDIQRALKTQQVANLTREAIVLSATIKQLITPEVINHPLYHARHDHTELGPAPSQLPANIISLVGHQITVISDPSTSTPVAVALAQPVTSHPLGTQASTTRDILNDDSDSSSV